MFFTQIRGFKLLYRFRVGWLDMSSDCIWPAYPIWEYPKMGCTPEMPLYLGNMILSMGFWGSLCSNKPVLDFLKGFPKSRKIQSSKTHIAITYGESPFLILSKNGPWLRYFRLRIFPLFATQQIQYHGTISMTCCKEKTGKTLVQ
jgi:hypothetical protein